MEDQVIGGGGEIMRSQSTESDHVAVDDPNVSLSNAPDVFSIRPAPNAAAQNQVFDEYHAWTSDFAGVCKVLRLMGPNTIQLIRQPTEDLRRNIVLKIELLEK
jgi:hypothetical protein